MKTEHEAKILDIDPDDMRDRLKKAGAVQTNGDRLMRRYVYDFDPADPNAWIRLRDEGGRVQLTIKEIHDDGITGTKELEIDVSDFDTTHEMLQRLGYEAKSYQENRRESWRLGDVAIEIDQWPGLPPYIEIEAEDEKAVIAAAKGLGYLPDVLCSENTKKLYARAGIDLDKVSELKF